MANCNVNTHERFADIQMLRYELKGFDALSLNQKLYIYCLAKATLMGRDITFDQQGKYNLRIRKPWRQSIAITRAQSERLSKHRDSMRFYYSNRNFFCMRFRRIQGFRSISEAHMVCQRHPSSLWLREIQAGIL